MAVSSIGTGSTIDVTGIVSQLMTVESQGLTKLQKSEASYNAKLSAFGQVKGAFASFQSAVAALTTPQQFQTTTAVAGDTSILSGSASASAVAGSYAIEVSQLAQAQKLAAPGQASVSAPIGTGTITLDFGTITGGARGANGKYTGASFASNGGGAKTITIDSTNNSLSGIRDAINAANAGVSASIVNDGSANPNRLVLTDKTTGAANSIRIVVLGDTALSNLLAHNPSGPPASQALSETVAAQNAQFTVDGLSISKSSNTVPDVVAGVTLNLTKTNAGTPTTFTVARDTNSVVASVTKFVSAYNAINKTLNDASAYDKNTKSAAILNGDSSIRIAQVGLRSILSSVVQGGSGSINTLSQVGVSLQKDGTLSLDPTKLNKALTTSFADVASVFASAGKTTDSLVSFVTSTADTKAGSYPVNITALATQASAVGNTPANLTIAAGSNDALTVNLNGLVANITLAPGTYASADALAAEVQSKINGASSLVGSTVKVTQSGGVFSVTTDSYGSNAVVSLSGTAAPSLLGSTPVTTPGTNVAGTINGVAGTGRGQNLVAATTDASNGIQVNITGGSTGSRGVINFSRGYAVQFNAYATAIIGAGGALDSRTKGLSTSITSLQKQEATEQVRLNQKQTDLRKLYSGLDSKLSGLSNTSSFLSQQLSKL